jgi:hypothetical protein
MDGTLVHTDEIRNANRIHFLDSKRRGHLVDLDMSRVIT